MHNIIELLPDLIFEPPIIGKYFETKNRKRLRENLDTVYDTGQREIEKKLKECSAKEKEGTLDEETLGQFIPYLYYVKGIDIKDLKTDILSILIAATETVRLSLSHDFTRGLILYDQNEQHKVIPS